MAWFRNRYTCERCGKQWSAEWSCMCDDDCQKCGARHISPHDSDELTHLIEQRGNEFWVLESSRSAEDQPDYSDVGPFPTQQLAEEYIDQS